MWVDKISGSPRLAMNKESIITTDVEKVCEALSAAFGKIRAALIPFADSAAVAARRLHELHRSSVLYIRHHYVAAGKPYGNGYARMMRWWRQQLEQQQ
jgi:hypothetical protein